MANSDEVIARLSHAAGLAELLDAAYDAFEHVLKLMREHDDPACELFVPMMLAAASAASGRDYVGMASALPAPPLARAVRHASAPAGSSADRITAICRLLTLALATAEGDAAAPEDRRACSLAARCAREITNLLSGQRA